MAICMENLQKGDIIFQHKANTNIKSSLITHTAIVAQQLTGFRRPLIFDITTRGFSKRPLPTSLSLLVGLSLRQQALASESDYHCQLLD